MPSIRQRITWVVLGHTTHTDAHLALIATISVWARAIVLEVQLWNNAPAFLNLYTYQTGAARHQCCRPGLVELENSRRTHHVVDCKFMLDRSATADHFCQCLCLFLTTYNTKNCQNVNTKRFYPPTRVRTPPTKPLRTTSEPVVLDSQSSRRVGPYV